MSKLTLAITPAVLLVAGLTARAEPILQISIGSNNIAAGQSGSVAVYISSNTPGSSIDLDTYNFEFQITTLSGPDHLQFATNQGDPYSDKTYVFYQDSGAEGYPLGNVSTQGTPNNTYIGGDYTSDGAEVAVGDPMLLTTLTVTTATGLPPVSGDTFLISLIQDSNTYFQDGGMNLNFTTNPGKITVEPANFVPEPPSAVMAAMALAGALFGRRMIRRPKG